MFSVTGFFGLFQETLLGGTDIPMLTYQGLLLPSASYSLDISLLITLSTKNNERDKNKKLDF